MILSNKRISVLMFFIFYFAASVLYSQNTGTKNNVSTDVNNSKIISYDIPEVLKPGEEFVITITLQNNGKNSWKRSDNYQLALYDEADNKYMSDVWGIKNVTLPYDVYPNEKLILLFKIKAPAENGTYNFRWAMNNGSEFFGEYTANLISVGGSQSNDGNSSQFISLSVPEFMNAGEKYKVVISMKNTGTNPWYSSENSDYKIAPVIDSSQTLFPDWNSSPVYLSGTIDSGQISTIEFDVTAPAVKGYYSLQWRMKKGDSFFGQETKRVNVKVTGNSKSGDDPRLNNSIFVSQEIPVSMYVNEDQVVSVTMLNTGNKSWVKGNEQLVVVDYNMSPVTLNIWGVGYIQLPENVDPKESVTFNFKVRPREPGWQRFQMILMKEDGSTFGAPTQALEINVSSK